MRAKRRLIFFSCSYGMTETTSGVISQGVQGGVAGKIKSDLFV